MHLAIELPNDFMALEHEHTVQKEMQLSYALRLYKYEKVTISRAAQLAGMDIYRFIGFCKEEKIPVIDISKQALQDELNALDGN